MDAVVARRDSVQQNLQRIRGRLDQAKKELADIDAECRAKGLDPEKLEETLTALIEQYDIDFASFEASVAQAEKDITPFLNI